MTMDTRFRVTIHFEHSTLVVLCYAFRIVYEDITGSLRDVVFTDPKPCVSYFDPTKVLAITREEV